MRYTRSFIVFSCLAGLPLSVGTAAGQGNTVTRDIVIGEDDAGKCVVRTSPSDIQSAKRNYRVNWNVRNECSSGRTVSLDNFKHEQDENRKKEPLSFLGQPPQIPAGESATIRALIKEIPDADLGTYKYDILIDGVVAEDPKLQIDG